MFLAAAQYRFWSVIVFIFFYEELLGVSKLSWQAFWGELLEEGTADHLELLMRASMGLVFG